MFTSVNVIEFRFSNAVVNVDGWAKKFVLSEEFIKSCDTSSSFLRNTFQIFSEFTEEFLVFQKTVINGFEKIVFIF